MNLRTPLITGTTISLAVTAVWAWLSALTIGPSGPLDVTWRHPAASYLTLVAAPTGNGLGLFTAIACDNPDNATWPASFGQLAGRVVLSAMRAVFDEPELGPTAVRPRRLLNGEVGAD
jgi:hypothetical protein